MKYGETGESEKVTPPLLRPPSMVIRITAPKGAPGLHLTGRGYTADTWSSQAVVTAAPPGSTYTPSCCPALLPAELDTAMQPSPPRWHRLPPSRPRPRTGSSSNSAPREPHGLTAISADLHQKIEAEPWGMSTPPLHQVSDTLLMPGARNPEPAGSSRHGQPRPARPQKGADSERGRGARERQFPRGLCPSVLNTTCDNCLKRPGLRPHQQ